MTDKVAIVTGASRGMGAACARELASRGYKTVVMARSEEVEALATEIGGIAVRGSVTEEGDIQKTVRTAIDAHGRIDAVVNSTGHPPGGPILDIPDADWHAGMDIVMLNVVRMARAVTPHMESQGGGAIANISTYAVFEPSLTFPVSSCLRIALAGFTKLFADSYADKNIRMNNILPGYIDSFPVNAEVAESLPMKRYGTVAEIAKTAAFLVSEDSGYITGQNLRVDGALARGV